MGPGPEPPPLRPAASAYLAAFDGWLAAGPNRNDTPLPELLDILADEIRSDLTPIERRYQQNRYPDVAALLALLR
jgi:hypothetical protein